MDVRALAQSVLDCPDEAVLRLLSLAPDLPSVTVETPVPEARRNYIRLAELLHPEKLKNQFEKATEVFQKLVRAFEKVADLRYRKTLLAQKAREEKQKGKARATGRKVKDAKPKQVVGSTSASATGPRKLSRREPVRKVATPHRKPPTDDDFIVHDEEDEGCAEEEEAEYDGDDGSDVGSEDLALLELNAAPSVSSNRSLIGTPRTGGIYNRTVVRCPQCRTTREPDSKQHYTLFMGPAGKRVHCEACLCRFGCATALHACPHCQHGFDYDATMYDTEVKCGSCKKVFGFPYYPVNQHLIDLVKLEEWRDRTEREKAVQRTQRAARRRTDSSGADEELHTLVGTCIVEEECPLCKKAVVSRHRQHVEACLKKTPAERKASETSQGGDDRGSKPKRKAPVSKPPASKKAAAGSLQPKKVLAKKSTKPAKVSGRKRQREKSFESDEEEPSFEDSFSDSDE